MTLAALQATGCSQACMEPHPTAEKNATFDEMFVDDLVSLSRPTASITHFHSSNESGVQRIGIVGLLANAPYTPPVAEITPPSSLTPKPEPATVVGSGSEPKESEEEVDVKPFASSSSSSPARRPPSTPASASTPASSVSPASLSSLPLRAFLNHMKAVDPTRARHYDEAFGVLDDALAGSDVRVSLGADRLCALGVKLGLVGRMLSELER